jgi:hypothetical protein
MCKKVSVCEGGENSLLDFLMKSHVKPRREENLQDLDGNTALHLFALPQCIRLLCTIPPDDK